MESKVHENQQKGQKVFIGMSGGVDSSVSAALLVEAGYDVTGVFIKVWQPDWIACTWREDRLDAMRVAAKLGIDFQTLDLEETYKREVVDYMIAEYKAGRTPNPDVMCNRHVKFGGFFDWAMEQGADYVATGHYARVEKHGEASVLLAGDDGNKDQSYFLWTLTQRELSHTLFPVGNIEKPEVRKLAARFGLPNAEKKDSQGLCFIGKIDVKDFLSRFIDKRPGNVIDDAGEVIGTHEGAWMYTKGERHGFIIGAKHKTPEDSPYYVVAKDVDANTVTVSDKKASVGDSSAASAGISAYGQQVVKIGQLNWTLGAAPQLGESLSARPRYRAPLAEISIESILPDEAVVRFSESQENLSSGQSLVIYDGSACLGGGIIQ